MHLFFLEADLSNDDLSEPVWRVPKRLLSLTAANDGYDRQTKDSFNPGIPQTGDFHLPSFAPANRAAADNVVCAALRPSKKSLSL